MTEPVMEIQFTSVYTYRNELIVELTCEDPEDGLIVVSYRFEYVEGSKSVSPKEPIDERFTADVAEAIREHGYRWRTPT